MSFTLGGEGTILPPRKKKGTGSDSTTKTGSAGGVQQSDPAFVEPGTRVAPAPKGTTLPLGTKSNVVSLADRARNRTLAQSTQDAIAKSGGIIIPAANIATPGGKVPPTPVATRPLVDDRPRPLRPGLSQKELDNLCDFVAIMESARFGRALTRRGVTIDAAQVQQASVIVAAAIQRLLTEGRITDADIQYCRMSYCKTYGCPAPEATPQETKTPEAAPIPASAPAQEPVPTQPQPMVYVPPTGGGSVIPTEPLKMFPSDVVAPVVPPTVVSNEKKKSNTLWWLLAIGAGALLVKKLAAIKVVGAAMAGAPLVAEMTDEDEEESESEEHEEVEGEEPVETEGPKGED